MADWKSLLATEGPKIALGFLAAKQGGPGAVAAFLQGMQEKAQLREQQARQGMLDQQAQEQQQFNRQNVESDNARQDEAARMDRLYKALALVQQRAAMEGETATDPAMAQQALQQTAQSAGGMFGVDPSQLMGVMPDIAPRISKRKAKQALDRYEALKKIYGEEAVAGDSITDTGEQFKGMKPSQLLQMAGMAAQGPQGQPAQPYVKPAAGGASDLDRSFQREKVARELQLGRPLTPAETAALDREIRASVRAINQPPSATEQLMQVTETDPDTGEVVTSLVPRKPGEVSRRPPAEPNQSQFTAAAYAGRMEQAEEFLVKVSPAITSMSLPAFEVQTNSWFAKPTFQSKDVQSYMQAARNFINAVLRRESGAVISPSEFTEAKAQYLPMPGEDKAALAQKAANRAYVFNTMKRAAGRAYEAPLKPPSGTVRMKAPDGTVKDVPADQVEHYKSLGAVVQ